MSIKEIFKRVMPNPVVRLGGLVIDVFAAAKAQALKFGDRYLLISPDTIYSSSWYESMANDKQKQKDSESVVRSIDDEFSPNSVLDLGCGVGRHLYEFEKLGASVHGVDGAKKVLEHSLVDSEKIEIHDLRTRYSTEKRYDLVICFEVAEHLPARFSKNLVQSVADSADVAVFTAATPGQGGTHHVNEQPRAYWKKLFAAEGMRYDSQSVECLRERMNVKDMGWIPENLFVFKK